jgi:3-oxoacyl-[acyl-carrier protein] reductase
MQERNADVQWMPVDLTGLTAVVGGASGGIGREVARHLAGLGARVVLLARNADRLEAARAELVEPGRHRILAADFADPAAVERAIASVVADEPVHILVNNTGGPAGGPITDARPDAFSATFSQHLICNHLLATAVLPGMRAAGFGRIVNIISTSVKQPLHGLGVSNTVRGAVANWSKTLANEVGPWGITVNNVLPGATDTERLSGLIAAKSERTGATPAEIRGEMAAEVPLRRIGRPEEIARAVAFLCSPAAAYISGINLPVDGGRTACL